MQKPLSPMQAVKLPRHKRGGIGSRTETWVNWGGPNAMVPCLHQGNIYFKMKLRVWRDQKCISLLGRKMAPTCAGHQTRRSQGSRHWPENGSLLKLGWTYHHGTVFARRQYLFQKEDKGMERPEMYSPSR